MSGKSQLQLFTVTWDKRVDVYGVYYKFVVCCNNEEEARQTHPSCRFFYDKESIEWSNCCIKTGKRYTDRFKNNDPHYPLPTWIDASKISKLTVTNIGTASSKAEKGVIISQFGGR